MKIPGMIRKVDELGRIVIPHAVRQALDIHSGDQLELICGEDCLVLRKFPAACVFCGCNSELMVYQEKHICRCCLQDLRRV